MRRGALIVLALAVLAVGAWQLVEARERERLLAEAEDVTVRYLRVLSSGRFEDLDPLTRSDEEVGRFHEDAFQTLLVDEASFERLETRLEEGSARSTFRARLVLADLGPWEYEGGLRLGRDGDGWVVVWDPSAFHPGLRPGLSPDRKREWPERGSVRDRDGDMLEVPLIVGSVGEATDEQVAELGDPYLPGDVVGQSGLEFALESHLAGRPSGEIRAVDEAGETRDVLHVFPDEPGRDVRTTIDVRVQEAAERVIDGGPTARAIVAVDPATGDLLAVANWPRTAFNRALEGRYPPGSTFKVVTAAAALRSGIAPDDAVSCPAVRDVGGWGFRNFEEMALGDISFERAIYDSCNTAFVAVTADLDDDLLLETVADFGFEVPYRLPLPHRGGTFPEWENVTMKAAQGFGQGRVESPPAHLATVAAAIADGTWRPPRLLLEPEWDAGAEPRDVSDVAEPLAHAMRLVVERGTAADAALPADVSGKTGTAEYGTGDPLPTHAWFIGYAPWGDGVVAFAVLVEDGEAGGRVAAPLAARFLAELRGE